MEYHALPQFKNTYEGDPKAELLKSVSSTLLGFENATISYTSADENIISFKNEADKLVMHANKYGKTKITITVSYNGSDVKKELEIEYKEPVKYNALTISEVYSKALNTEVIVKGVVAAGVVNQNAFYLVDETGMIAIRTTKDVISMLSLGNEVIIKGKFTDLVSSQRKEHHSQYHITDAELLVNNGGNNVYSNATFVSSTVKDVSELCSNKDINGTKNVYVISAVPRYDQQEKFSNMYLDDGENSIRLYSGSGKQYEWILDYTGNVKYEVTLNAWNGKYAVSLIAIILEDGTRVCNPYNFSK